jgi:hypothetical protein
LEIVTIGQKRLTQALKFARGEAGKLKRQYESERQGWNLYCRIPDAAVQALKNEDPFVMKLQKKGAIAFDTPGAHRHRIQHTVPG